MDSRGANFLLRDVLLIRLAQYPHHLLERGEVAGILPGPDDRRRGPGADTDGVLSEPSPCHGWMSRISRNRKRPHGHFRFRAALVELGRANRLALDVRDALDLFQVGEPVTLCYVRYRRLCSLCVLVGSWLIR